MAFLILYVTAFGPFCGLANHVPVTETAVRTSYRPLAWVAVKQPPVVRPFVRKFLEGYCKACEGGNMADLIFVDLKPR